MEEKEEDDDDDNDEEKEEVFPARANPNIKTEKYLVQV